MSENIADLGGCDEDETKCVLVVEDDAMLRRVVVRTLQSWGFDIREAPDGEAAIDQVCECHSDLSVILLDIMLPLLDGVEVARRVHRDRPSLPIVACSAALDDQIIANLREAGVRHFLPKPYSAASLRATLHNAMAG
ncbi:MAG: two-component hybrid sensor and regulator [Planctomycetota bacterium]|nr:two-component hybrid sensor and regulator [Planctomycetota bacterium]